MTKRKEGWHVASHVILALILILVFGAFVHWKNKDWNKVILQNKDLTAQLKLIELEDAKIKTKRDILVDCINGLQFRLDPVLVEVYADAIMTSAKKWNIHPNLIACMVYRESSFNPVAVSRMGAVGPMQVILKWHMDKIKRRGWSNQDATYLVNNIDLGSEIIREYFDSKGNIKDALLKYVGDKNGSHIDYVIDILEMFTESLNGTERGFTYKDMIKFEEVENSVVSQLKDVTKVIEPTTKKIKIKGET